MTSIAYSSINIQTSPQSVPTPPCWFGEVTLMVQHLQHQGVLTAIEKQVRFAHQRFGHYDVMDFVAVLFGYAISGERTLEAFYERIGPWAEPFMALFGRDRLPARSTLNRFLAALDQITVERCAACFLRTCWLGLSRTRDSQMDSSIDRGRTCASSMSMARSVAARQRALPQTADRPAPTRRLRALCVPGYTGRKRGEVVRTRTTILQAHTHQW